MGKETNFIWWLPQSWLHISTWWRKHSQLLKVCDFQQRWFTEIFQHMSHFNNSPCHKSLDSPSFKTEQFSNFNNTPTYTTFNLPSWHHAHSRTGWWHCWFQSEYEPASPGAQNNSEVSQNNGPITFIFTSIQKAKLSLRTVSGMSGG
jgi:hypothetical protein